MKITLYYGKILPPNDGVRFAVYERKKNYCYHNYLYSSVFKNKIKFALYVMYTYTLLVYNLLCYGQTCVFFVIDLLKQIPNLCPEETLKYYFIENVIKFIKHIY